MMRPAFRHAAVLVLLAGLILRAATPLGYMPAAPGSGLLFELCPGQLPAGLTLPGTSPAHDHHHHGADDKSQPEPDQCPIGHLLTSAMAADNEAIDTSVRVLPAGVRLPVSVVRTSALLSANRSRGPPA